MAKFLLLAIPAILACSRAPESMQHTVQDRLDQFATPVKKRLAPKFKAAKIPYPPKHLAYVVFKDTNILQVYARPTPQSPWKHVTEYEVQRASGELGPKLREGDYQVPEGIYRAESLNPNSRFHLSIRVNYPNAFDRKQAAAEKRTNLGGDIMIHGSNVSIGCLAMGDPAAEDLFILAANAGPKNLEIIIAPTDFRRPTKSPLPTSPAWVKTLYANLKTKLKTFPLRPDAR